ncbi:MAG: hypothetical protein A4E48_00039 [Methanosaeta sp. PtaU1.Bin060]|nr:MAG: hypothetical protein A4E48_00039 [Methanosaeta sp. PtaU1.Bin060]
MAIDYLKSKQLVAIKSELPLSIVFSLVNEATKKRIVYGQATGLSAQKSKSNKICVRCGNPKGGNGLLCLACYQKLRSIRVVLRCTLCGKEHEKYLYDYRKALNRGQEDFYCSKACSQKHHAVKHARSCTYCGQPMPGKRRNKYCSETCRTASRLSKRPVKICPICEAEFIPRSSRAQFCSRECASAAHSERMVGLGNSHYQDGMSYAMWFTQMRPLILERDGHKCVVCGLQEAFTRITWNGQDVQRSNLVIHHLNEAVLDNTPENLVTLCQPCHMIHHKSKSTPYLWFGSYAVEKSLSMTSRWKAATISLRKRFSPTTVSS